MRAAPLVELDELERANWRVAAGARVARRANMLLIRLCMNLMIEE
jgi:hypothetical protein